MAKYAALFVVALLLLVSLTQAARPDPAGTRNINNQDKSAEEAGPERAAEEGCGGVGEEECLMRRTLAAHADYIYTREKKN